MKVQEIQVKADAGKLRAVRGNLSQEAFATIIGVTQGFIGHIENGRRQPGMDVLARYSAIAKKPIEYFLIKQTNN
jgi:transcriptional regulator with XRE-family HTH domain